MPYAKANDINMYYEYEGKGPPLVIIGGFATIHKMWIDFIKPLQNQYKVLIFDNRGFGDSDVTPPPYSIEMMAKDTKELMDSLKIQKSYILGHSMGSAIAQRMCLDYPQKVKKALLVGTFLKVPYVTAMFFELIPDLFQQNVSLDTLLPLIMLFSYSSEFIKDKDNFIIILEYMKKVTRDPNGYEGQAQALRQFDSSSWASKITSDILVLAGKQDLVTPLYCSEEIVKKLKNAKLRIVEGAAHMIFFEEPQKALEIITNFFK